MTSIEHGYRTGMLNSSPSTRGSKTVRGHKTPNCGGRDPTYAQFHLELIKLHVLHACIG